MTNPLLSIVLSCLKDIVVNVQNPTAHILCRRVAVLNNLSNIMLSIMKVEFMRKVHQRKITPPTGKSCGG